MLRLGLEPHMNIVPCISDLAIPFCSLKNILVNKAYLILTLILEIKIFFLIYVMALNNHLLR